MNIETVLSIVSNHFETDITKKSRERSLTYMRAIFYKLCKEFTKSSLYKIGDSCNVLHASVINGLRKYNDEYRHQLDPFDVSDEYSKLYMFLDRLREEEIEVSYNELNEELLRQKTINKLSAKCIDLGARLKIANEKIKELDSVNFIKVENRFIPVLRELKDMSDTDISDFVETRLKPYIRAIHSRVYHKEIVEVQGALINR